ncbi:uncharacterized protein [Ptychodera flava]|uniref:uncharacterized protein isoform X2 n=1 Tax=Ptychodera flava TaxID=63121 RepID=UPI00396A882F
MTDRGLLIRKRKSGDIYDQGLLATTTMTSANHNAGNTQGRSSQMGKPPLRPLQYPPADEIQEERKPASSLPSPTTVFDVQRTTTGFPAPLDKSLEVPTVQSPMLGEFTGEPEESDVSGSGDHEKKIKKLGGQDGNPGIAGDSDFDYTGPTTQQTMLIDRMTTESDSSSLTETGNIEEDVYSGSGSGMTSGLPDDSGKKKSKSNKGRLLVDDKDDYSTGFPNLATREEVKKLLMLCASRGSRYPAVTGHSPVNVSTAEIVRFGLDLKVDRCNGEPIRFHPDLKDQFSELFITLELHFVQLINRVIRRTKLYDAYLDYTVLGFRPGSIVVESVMSLYTHYNLTTNTVKSILQKAIEANSDEGFYIDTEAMQISDFNECASNDDNDCSLNADCLNTKGSFTCKCKFGYLDAAEVTSQLPGRACSAVCSDDYCQNGGTCLPDNDDGEPKPSCKCAIGYSGSNCEIVIEEDNDREQFKKVTIVVIVVGALLVVVVMTILVIGCWSHGKCRRPNVFSYRRRMTFSRTNTYTNEGMELPSLDWKKNPGSHRSRRSSSTVLDFVRYSPYLDRMLYKGMDEETDGHSDRVSTTDSCRALPPSQDGDCDGDDVISVPDTALLNKNVVTVAVEREGSARDDDFLHNFQQTDLGLGERV